MIALDNQGFRTLSELLLELYAPGDLPSFRRRMLKAAHRAFGGEMVCHNEIDLSTGESLSVLARPVEGFDELRDAFFAHVHEHPSIQHLIGANGDENTAVKTSDFVTQRRWRSTGLYREFYRELDDIRYQLTIGHKVDSRLLFFAISRTSSDFTESERTLLTLLRPHFIQAYENARTYSPAKNGHAAANTSQDLPRLVCDRTGRILGASESCLQILERWFPSDRADYVPEALRTWMHGSFAKSASLPELRRPFRRVDHRGELEVRVFLDAKAETRELLFRERAAGNGVGALRSAFGLSRREMDVLRWLVEGKTNQEIALILGLSLSTVKTHISKILRRLDVETRSAAVSRAMEQTRFQPGFHTAV